MWLLLRRFPDPSHNRTIEGFRGLSLYRDHYFLRPAQGAINHHVRSRPVAKSVEQGDVFSDG
jgi:hypothetical protein